MSKLPPLPHWCEPGSPFAEQMQAYATAATEPLLQRIAELEEINAQLREQNTEVDKSCAELERRIEVGKNIVRNDMHRIGQLQARVTELERQLEEARNHALEEAAKVCENMQQGWPSDDQLKCADAIRALKGAKG